MLKLTVVLFCGVVIFGLNSFAEPNKCVSANQSQEFIRNEILIAADLGYHKNKATACTSVARMAGRLNAVSNYISQYYDRDFQDPLARALGTCKIEIETLKAACGDGSAAVDMERRKSLEDIDVKGLNSLSAKTSSCIKKSVQATMPQKSGATAAPAGAIR